MHYTNESKKAFTKLIDNLIQLIIVIVINEHGQSLKILYIFYVLFIIVHHDIDKGLIHTKNGSFVRKILANHHK